MDEFEDFRRSRIRRTRMPMVVMSLLMVLMGFMIQIFKGHLSHSEQVYEIFGTLAYIFIFVGVGVYASIFLLTYLNFGSTYRDRDDLSTGLSSGLLELSTELHELKKQIQNIGAVKVDIKETDRSTLLETLRSTISESLGKATFKAIDEEFAKREQKAKELDRLIANFDLIRERLLKETGNLSRRANLNLVLGSLTTMGAGIGLLYIVFRIPLDLSNVLKEEYIGRIVAHYLPRFFTITFIEVFAFFFLRLYRSGLSDIKFYQNELTNVEMKLAALRAALAIQDNDATRSVITDLSKTERNFILNSGETTIELEKMKAEKTNMKDWLEQLASLVKAKS
jgi:ABC-type multidrug transport system fused ATPase/permease subunit